MASGDNMKPHTRQEIRRLWNEGDLSSREIGQIVGVSRSTVCEFMKHTERIFFRKCVFCGEDFVTNNIKQEYCTKTHGALARTYRNRGWDYSTYPRHGGTYKQSEATIERINDLRRMDWPSSEIGKLLGLSKEQVQRYSYVVYGRECRYCGGSFMTVVSTIRYCPEHRNELCRYRVRMHRAPLDRRPTNC